MEHLRFERYAWDSAEKAFKDLGYVDTKRLVLVDSDCIVYPTAFSNITTQGVEAAQQAAVNKLTALLQSLPSKEDYHIVQIFTSSGSPKYRDQFIKQVPYKANRKTSTAKPPEYVKEITEALTEHSVSIYCDPLAGEADDYISIFGNQVWNLFGRSPFIVGYDKDLLQIPGVHYRGKESCQMIWDSEAQRFLHRQMLQGDNADNIPGLKGIGPAKAKLLIKDQLEDPEEMFSIVCKEYCNRMEGTEDEITDYLFETANLLYLRRDFNDHWNPPI